MNEEQLLDETIRREGSRYTNRPSDLGGPTKYGITLRTLRAERGNQVTAADVEALTEAEARAIYRSAYIRRPGFHLVADERLRALLIDYGINSGQATAVKVLQQAVGAMPDGVLGPDTVRRLHASDLGEVYASVMRARLELYIRLALSKPEVRAFLKANPRAQLHNLAGWLNRLGEFF